MRLCQKLHGRQSALPGLDFAGEQLRDDGWVGIAQFLQQPSGGRLPIGMCVGECDVRDGGGRIQRGHHRRHRGIRRVGEEGLPQVRVSGIGGLCTQRELSANGSAGGVGEPARGKSRALVLPLLEICEPHRLREAVGHSGMNALTLQLAAPTDQRLIDTERFARVRHHAVRPHRSRRYDIRWLVRVVGWRLIRKIGYREHPADLDVVGIANGVGRGDHAELLGISVESAGDAGQGVARRDSVYPTDIGQYEHLTDVDAVGIDDAVRRRNETEQSRFAVEPLRDRTQGVAGVDGVCSWHFIAP
jgi:hypothetical protein